MESLPLDAFASKKEALRKSIRPKAETIKAIVNDTTDEKGEVPADYKCNICLMLVHEPHECSTCE